MRWQTGINHKTSIPPKVTLKYPPATDYPAEVKIDIRGGGIYLSLDEARQLGHDLLDVLVGTEEQS